MLVHVHTHVELERASWINLVDGTHIKLLAEINRLIFPSSTLSDACRMGTVNSIESYRGIHASHACTQTIRADTLKCSPP